MGAGLWDGVEDGALPGVEASLRAGVGAEIKSGAWAGGVWAEVCSRPCALD